MNKKISIISIGDLHGRDYWIYEDYSKYDKIIFVGDYVDSLEISNELIIKNLNNLIEFKKNNMNKVILLWGNHDIQYYLLNHKCIGFNEEIFNILHEIFSQNKYLFQLSYQIKNYIWTHAGIHKGWWSLWIKDKNKIKENENIADTLNRLFDENYQPLFNCGIWRGGRHSVGGPLWLDNLEAKKPIEGYHQIVGHSVTNNNKIKHIYEHFKGKNTSITFIDTENFENYILELWEA